MRTTLSLLLLPLRCVPHDDDEDNDNDDDDDDGTVVIVTTSGDTVGPLSDPRFWGSSCARARMYVCVGVCTCACCWVVVTVGNLSGRRVSCGSPFIRCDDSG